MGQHYNLQLMPHTSFEMVMLCYERKVSPRKQWNCHVLHISNNRIPLRLSQMKVLSITPLGRLQTRWRHQVREGTQASTKQVDRDTSGALTGGQRKKALSQDHPHWWKSQFMIMRMTMMIIQDHYQTCQKHHAHPIYSLSRIPVRAHAAQATDAVTCTFSAHSTHHAEVMLPFVFPWRTHCLLCILPVQFFIVCLLLTCCLHSNHHRNYTIGTLLTHATQ